MVHALVAALPPTRFAHLPAWGAGLVLAALVALTTYGLVPGARGVLAPVPPTTTAHADETDLKLYKTIAARVAAGETYYAAATAEQRREGYPLRPFVTVRLPTLALLHAKLGLLLTGALVDLAVLGAFCALVLRLRSEVGPGRLALYGSALAAIGLGPTLAPTCLYWHEPLAAVLLTLALACRSGEHWLASVLLAFAAVAVRELALPFLMVMLVAALVDGTRREAAAWGTAIAASLALLATHALLLSAYVTPNDLHSPGWTGLGGWHFVLQMAHNFSSFSVLPRPLVAIVLPLALLGWAAWPGAFAFRGALALYGYICAFMIFGRPDNDYWVMIIAPLVPIGLVFAPSALRDLASNVRGRQSHRSTGRTGEEASAQSRAFV